MADKVDIRCISPLRFFLTTTTTTKTAHKIYLKCSFPSLLSFLSLCNSCEVEFRKPLDVRVVQSIFQRKTQLERHSKLMIIKVNSKICYSLQFKREGGKSESQCRVPWESQKKNLPQQSPISRQMNNEYVSVQTQFLLSSLRKMYLQLTLVMLYQKYKIEQLLAK